MKKEKFYEIINFGRYPKYALSQIKEGKPTKNCVSIVCTASGNILYAMYENGKWYQTYFTSAPDQRIYCLDINEDVIFWTDGEAKDRSREQFKQTMNNNSNDYISRLDEIDKWLFDNFGFLPGCCSSINEMQHSTARMVAEALWPKKDGGLTIQDLELLHTFLYAVKNNKQGAFTFTWLSNEQYEEVLRRFNKNRKK